MPALKYYEEEAIKNTFVLNNTILGLDKSTVDRITNECINKTIIVGKKDEMKNCFIKFLTDLDEKEFVLLLEELNNTKRQQKDPFIDLDFNSNNS